MTKSRAVFLDRDGTINEEVGYLDSFDKLRLFPDAAGAIRRINEEGLKAVVVTNQSGVARGYYTEAFVRETHDLIQALLRKEGAFIDAFYYCPHLPAEGRGTDLAVCGCRKPKPGMLLKASEDLAIDLSASYMVGDTLKDMETARNARTKGILVLTGHGAAYQPGTPDAPIIKPDFIAANLLDAVDWILKDCGS
jgi:D,D-heptose 1,7-bisphosphate phosphatase